MTQIFLSSTSFRITLSPSATAISRIHRHVTRLLIALALIAATVVGAPAALDAQTATPNAPAWTLTSPATRPTARYSMATAYDAATGTIVLFGGESSSSGTDVNDTWTWNGTTWAQQSPATSPPVRESANRRCGTGQ